MNFSPPPNLQEQSLPLVPLSQPALIRTQKHQNHLCEYQYKPVSIDSSTRICTRKETKTKTLRIDSSETSSMDTLHNSHRTRTRWKGCLPRMAKRTSLPPGIRWSPPNPLRTQSRSMATTMASHRTKWPSRSNCRRTKPVTFPYWGSREVCPWSWCGKAEFVVG